ncbi:GIY-YIG nuclease family protein [Deinococcus yavapaiensis]|uniref:GIY-YIG catalytic domain-containing protein n=1 Tax=Deinococcus yavapaiensis KR-236 TaxID=694435 RepID=A0A318S5A6_9DEIO|nr:GIY-YIG nuclease family protein [Deinococcus yavapaiensis]PYE53294.1 hypothetical protein DES52_10966 [Deinococcus yavapaiensis KR-236]
MSTSSLFDLTADLGFPAFQEVAGRRSVADLYRGSERCGIYVLHFANGEAYAGQSVDVTRRFHDHRKTHPDITHMTFRRVPKRQLDEVERHVIHALERGRVPLRNIVFASVVTGERDLDLLVTPDEQRAWLDGQALPDEETRVQDDDLRRRYHAKFERLKRHPHYEEIRWALGTYVARTIPAPKRTELTFWAVSCLPSTNKTSLSRVNINLMETLMVFDGPERPEYACNIARTPLHDRWGTRWQEHVASLGLTIENIQYRTSGEDHVFLFAPTITSVERAFQDETVVQAMRAFNMRLLRKGPTVFYRYHCFDLADDLFSPLNDRPPGRGGAR